MKWTERVSGQSSLVPAITCALVLAASPALGFDWNRAFDKTLDFVDQNLESLQQPEDTQQNQQQQPSQAQPKATTPPPTATSAVSRQQIQTVQSQLLQLGYAPGPADGFMGGRTQSAIREFQTDQGLTPTGRIDVTLERSLATAVAAIDTPRSPSIDSSHEKTASQIQSEKLTTSHGDVTDQTNTAIGGPWKYAPLPSAPQPLLVYKFLPGAFSNEDLTARVKAQVAQDQRHYKIVDTISESQRPPARETIFTREEVVGRNVDFLVPELMDSYKARVAELARNLPSRYSVLLTSGRAQYDHDRGVLYIEGFNKRYLINPVPTAGPGIEPRGYTSFTAKDSFVYTFNTFARFEAELSKKHAYAFGSTFADRETLAQTHVPYSLTRSLRGVNIASGGVFIALDRRPQVPAFAVSTADAERMLTETPPHSMLNVSSSMTPEQLNTYLEEQQKIADAHTKEMQRFLNAFPFLIEIEFTGARMVDNRLYLDARLLEATLFGSRAETLARYAASDFLSASTALASLQQAEQATQAKVAAAEEAEHKRLAGLDILGVKLGMSVDSARAIVAEQMDVDTVYRMSGLKSGITYSDSRAPNPYNEGLVMIGDGGKNVIALFEDEGRVVGISRRMSGVDLPDDQLGNALVGKFGAVDVDWGSSQWIWGDLGEKRSCLATAVQSVQEIQLDMVSGSEPPTSPWMGPHSTYGAMVGMDIYQTYQAATENSLARCGPMLRVTRNATPSHPQSTVDFLLYDHSMVASRITTLQADEKVPVPEFKL